MTDDLLLIHGERPDESALLRSFLVIKELCGIGATLQLVYRMMKDIPIGNDWRVNRYDTDDEYVLSVWRDGETHDIRLPR